MTPLTRPECAARALPMLTQTAEPGQQAAEDLGLPYLRVVDGQPTIIRGRSTNRPPATSAGRTEANQQ